MPYSVGTSRELEYTRVDAAQPNSREPATSTRRRRPHAASSKVHDLRHTHSTRAGRVMLDRG